MCCDPSSSMINLISTAAKSATYPFIGICRRNFTPGICRLRNLCQSILSASVWFFLSILAVFVSPLLITLTPALSQRERGVVHSCIYRFTPSGECGIQVIVPDSHLLWRCAIHSRLPIPICSSGRKPQSGYYLSFISPLPPGEGQGEG